MIKPDSLIFDMDGTLWDNVNTYVIVWNKGLEMLGYDKRVTRDELMQLMGKEAQAMLDRLVPHASTSDQNKLFDTVIEAYHNYIPQMQPILYDGVGEGLALLSEKYPLFLLSNCEEGGLVNYMNHTQTTHLFKDYMEHGQNLMPKSHNLVLLKERNNLQHPVYIGDTDGDRKSSEAAGVPFVYVSYGFGKTNDYHIKFDNFSDLTSYFLNL